MNLCAEWNEITILVASPGAQGVRFQLHQGLDVPDDSHPLVWLLRGGCSSWLRSAVRPEMLTSHILKRINKEVISNHF